MNLLQTKFYRQGAKLKGVKFFNKKKRAIA